MKSRPLHTLRGAVLVLLVVGLVFCAPISLSACAAQHPTGAGASSSAEHESGLVIVASMFASYDFARTLAGEVAEVSLLVPPGVETHAFEPSPADIIKLNSADVLITVGGESDAWLEKVIGSLDNSELVVVRLTDIVETLEEVELQGVAEHEDEHAITEDEHETDEHVWTSLRNAQTIVDALARTFAELDSQNAQLFLDNAQALNDQLATLDNQITRIVADAKRTTILFGDRFPFRYFTEDYGLTYFAAFPGCSTAVDTDPATIAFLVDTVRELELPTVFYIELSNKRIAQTIASETGTQTLLFHSAHNISKEDFDAGVTYLSLMQANADNLEVALN